MNCCDQDEDLATKSAKISIGLKIDICVVTIDKCGWHIAISYRIHEIYKIKRFLKPNAFDFSFRPKTS